MLTPEDIAQLAQILANMTDEEVDGAMKRIEIMAEMEETINVMAETNPMVFSSCETVQ